MIQNPYPTPLNRLNPMVSDSRGDPSTTILINGHSNKLSLSSFDRTDWWISQLSSEKLLFAVDGDLDKVKTGQCEESKRLWAAQLQTEVYIPHYPHKVQGSSWKGDKMIQEEERNSCAGLDSTRHTWAQRLQEPDLRKVQASQNSSMVGGRAYKVVPSFRLRGHWQEMPTS